MKNFWSFRPANFNFHPLKLFSLLLLFVALLVSQSCKKEISSIGIDLRDDLLNAVFTDTVTLMAYSVLESAELGDTLNTTNLRSNYLGYLNDNIFGNTTASIYTQFLTPYNAVDFGKSPVLDSIVLTLKYQGDFYGDTLQPFVIKVYQLSEDISSEVKYYHTDSIKSFPANLTYESSFILTPSPNKKVKLDTVTDPHVRIRLTDDLGNLFLQNKNEMETPTKFKKFFKGLFISAEPYDNKGSMVNFALTASLTGIQLYYKNDSVPKRISFPVATRNLSGTRFSHYQHDYEAGDPNFVNQVLHKDSTLGKNILYLQSMGGVKTKITFPYIKALKDRKIVINKAELVITNKGDKITQFPPPDRVNLYGINPSGTHVFLPDYEAFVGAAYWGGKYDATTKEYRLRITRYIQDIILKDNFQSSIYLVARGSELYANRLLLYGTNPTETASRLRLEIYYTEY